jgi:hypothetical protein
MNEDLIKVKDFIEKYKVKCEVVILDKNYVRVGEYTYYPDSKNNKFIMYNGTGLVLSKIKNYYVKNIKILEE